MATPPIQAPSASNRNDTASPVARADNVAERPQTSELSPRDALNARILEASLEVSIRSGNDAQALLFRTAIDRINDLLAPEFGPDALQRAAANEDTSAEATAARILGFSTGFFDAYAAQRPGDDPEQVARDFVDLIRGGFEQGFNEARDILDGLGVLGGDVESGIMKTWELVHKGLDDFLAGKLPAKETDAGLA